MSRFAFLTLFFVVWLAAEIAPPAEGAHHGTRAGGPTGAAKTPQASPGDSKEIRGRVVNGTLNRPASAGLEVRLISIDGEKVQPLGVTKTDASGRFAFPGAKAPQGGKGHLLAVTQYQGVPYMALAPSGGKEGRLLIFDLTQDPLGISVEAHRVWVRFEEGRLVFREAIRLVNRGKATYVAAGGETLAFSLPPGAELLQPPGGLNPQGVRMGPGLVSSFDPLPPGPKQVDLLYAISDPPAQLHVEKKFRFPTKRFAVMVPELGMRLPSPSDLKYEGVFGEDIGNRAHLASKADLPAGGRVRFILSRDVDSPFAESMFLGIAAVVVLGLAVPFALRRRRLARQGAGRKERKDRAARVGTSVSASLESGAAPSTPSPPERSAAPDWARERSEIVRLIAALDDDWEAGRIPEKRYESRRAELKARALETSKKIERP